MSTPKPGELGRARVRWRNVRSGAILVMAKEVVVYRRKVLRGFEEVARFQVAALTQASPGETETELRLTFRGPQGDTGEVFSFAEKKDLDSMQAIFAKLLKEAEEEKKRQEEEAARLKKEKEERDKRLRETFANEMWETSEALWLINKSNYAMVNAVVSGDWSLARQEYSTVWQQADRLNRTNGIDIVVTLKALDEAVAAKNGEEVITRAGGLLKDLSTLVMTTEPLWAKWQGDADMLSAVSPNCNHLAYFMLFGAGHFESLLSSRIEDWTGVKHGLSVVGSSGPILRRCFSLDINRPFEVATSASSARQVDFFAEGARQIEGAVMESFKARPAQFETQPADEAKAQ